jgi:hypothetical protein
MPNVFRALALITLIIISTKSFAQNVPGNCAQLMSGRLNYIEADDPTAYILRNGNSQMEFFLNGRYYIKLKTKWTSPCHYRLTFKKTNYPDKRIKMPKVIEVDVVNVDGDIITYKATTPDGLSLIGKFKKVSE